MINARKRKEVSKNPELLDKKLREAISRLDRIDAGDTWLDVYPDKDRDYMSTSPYDIELISNAYRAYLRKQ